MKIIKRIFKTVKEFFIVDKPDVYWEIGGWGGGRLRYKNWASIDKKFERQFKAARELKLCKQKNQP